MNITIAEIIKENPNINKSWIHRHCVSTETRHSGASTINIYNHEAVIAVAKRRLRELEKTFTLATAKKKEAILAAERIISSVERIVLRKTLQTTKKAS